MTKKLGTSSCWFAPELRTLTIGQRTILQDPKESTVVNIHSFVMLIKKVLDRIEKSFFGTQINSQSAFYSLFPRIERTSIFI